MKLISPNFLKYVNVNLERERIFDSLYESEDIISVIMEKKGLNFNDACEWASMLLTGNSAPEASESEKFIMMQVAQDFIAEWKESKEKDKA
jgi:hypothetical protein